LELVVITHPIHPMVGLSLPVVRLVRALGRPSVVVRFPDGHTAAIPLDWTDRHPTLPPLQVKGRGALLHPGFLQEMRVLVDSLLTAKTSSAAKLDGSAPSRTVSAHYEHPDAGNDLPSVVDRDPASVPRRPRQHPAQGRGAAAKQRGR